MIYVLDTDILSILAHEDAPAAARIRHHILELPAADSVVTTVITYEEQTRGWMAALSRAKTASAQVQVYQRLLQHLNAFRRITVLPYDDAAAAVAEQLKRQKLRIGAMDLKIASITLARDAVLITRNAIDFRQVLELRIEDWSGPTS